jgi:DNA helicase II / ATP-dependent DNA helicase PcrA
MEHAYLIAAHELRKNPEQWKAYESQGNVVILAGPGSGKTKTISVKLARLLHEDVHPPRGVAALTYNIESARELKHRLNRLGIEESKRVYVGTIHAFCLKHVITPFADLAGLRLPIPLGVASREQAGDLLAHAVHEISPYENPKKIETRIAQYRRRYLDRNADEWQAKDPETAAIIEKYEELLRENGLIDFDDMILNGFWLLRDHAWVRRLLAAKFPVLIVDEYQDLGSALHEIVLQLINTGVRVIAVGDPDQSIYDFTGARPELLRELAQRDDVEEIRLRMNYRNGAVIVSSSLAVLREDREFESAQEADGTILIKQIPEGVERQAEIICDEIIPNVLGNLKGRQLGDIAVLYNDKFDASIITRAVRDRGMKYLGGDRQRRYPATPLTQWLEDSAAWCSGGWLVGEPRITSLINFWALFNWETSNRAVAIEIRRKLINFLWQRRDPKLLLKDWLDDLIELGVRDLLRTVRIRPGELESLDSLYAAALDPERLGGLTIGAFGGFRGASDHLNLHTLHGSKGLEFDAAIIMGLEQGKLPSFWAKSDRELREQRRRFYVGLTRARYEVYLLYSGWYDNGYRRFDNGPSEYIEEVRRQLR